MISPRLIFYGVCAVAIAALAYGLYRAGHDKAELEGQLREMATYAQGQEAARFAAEENLRQVNVANALNAMRFAEDQLALNRLEELAHETPTNADRCLPADASRRVRDIR